MKEKHSSDHIKVILSVLFAALIVFCILLPQKSAFASSKSPYSFTASSKTLYTGWKSYLCSISGVGEEADIIYESADENVAAVSDEGEIFPVSKGKTTIIAYITENGYTDSCSMKITVKDPYSRVTSKTDAMTLNGSFTFTLKRYGHNEPVTWTLAGEGLAEIEAVSPTDCMLHALKSGNIILTASCMDESFSFNIKIYNGEGELFIISPDSDPYNNNYVKYGTYNSNTKGYYLIRSYLERLNTLKGGVLVLKKGTYTVTNTLCIPSDTTIILEDGATVKKSDTTGTSYLTATASLFQTVSYTNSSKEGIFKGYNGEKNISILGEGNACIDLNNIMCQGIISAHCQNLTVSGISFKNMNTYHFIELAASKNVKIINNYFYGSAESATSRKEAINLDTPDETTGGFHQYWTSYDKTPNKDVYITDNVFYNVECAVGTHKYSEGYPHDNVNILRNTMIDCNTYAIRAMNWNKPVITHNSFIYSVMPEYSKISIIVNGSTNPLITENRFENIETPISFYHWYNSGYGKQYGPIYNTLEGKYLEAIRDNLLVNVVNPYCEYYEVLDDYSEDNLIKISIS